jgi:23S rRNA pseudouridine2605 synthase
MTENPPPPGDRIAKVLSRAGIASRREAERMIADGRVAVNGQTITSPALNVTGEDRIAVDGKTVSSPEPLRLWLYHKPAGLVTSDADDKGRKTIYNDLPEDMPRVMSVGRLDLNSEGLLLLTNDGTIKRRLELPATGWLRRYRVRVNGRPTDDMLEPLRRGVTVADEVFQPMSVTLDRQQGANAWLTIGLREGRNREIRRALAEIGLTVNRLIRISYGPFQLGELKPGEVQEVRRKVLRDQLGPAYDDALVAAGLKPARPDAPIKSPRRVSRGKPGRGGGRDRRAPKASGT